MQIPKSFTFWAIVAIAVLAFVIGMLTCNNRKNPPPRELHPTVSEIDSVNQKRAEQKAFTDSVLALLNQTKKAKDSIAKIVVKQSDLLEVKTLKINALTKEAALYRKYGDDIAYMGACDSLLPQISDLTFTVDLYRHDNANLMDSIQRIEDQQSILNARQQFFQGEMNATVDRLNQSALQLESTNRKLEKKANRKWSINLGASYIFDGQQWRYGAGVSIGRSLVRF
jgi:predicted  nucleic acid-binding Zn-ribbon protein